MARTRKILKALPILLATVIFSQPLCAVELTVLYTGDTYGYQGRDGAPGGFAKRKAAIDQIKKTGRKVVLVDNGNALGQVYYARFDEGGIAAELMGKLGYDAFNLGAHDFDYGQKRILELAERHRLPVVSSNIVKENGDPFATEIHRLKKGGVRIAILGICDPLVRQQTIVGQFDGLQAKDPLETLREKVQRARENSDLLILLANLNYFDSEKIAKAIPDFDIIISRPPTTNIYNHDDLKDIHTFTTHSSTQGKRHKTIIATVSHYAWRLGQIDLSFKKTREGLEVRRVVPSVIDLPANAPEDLAIKERVAGFVGAMTEKHGAILVSGVKDKIKGPMTRQIFLDLLASLLRNQSRSEISIINYSFFSKIPYTLNLINSTDVIREMDIQRVFWAHNHIVKGVYSGEQLEKIIEEGDGKLIFKGITRKNKKTFINGRPLQKKEEYSVATSNYLTSPQSPIPSLLKGKFFKEKFLVKKNRLVSHKLGRPIIIRELFMSKLPHRLPIKPESDYPPQWSFSFDEINLSASNLSVNNNTPFATVPDARVQSTNLFSIGSVGRINLNYDRQSLTWKSGVDARFERVQLPGNVVNNTQDRLLITEQLNAKSWSFHLGEKNQINPFLQGAYDTEFTAQAGASRRQFARLTPGLTTTWGGLFKEMRIGPSAEIDFSQSTTVTAYGGSFGYRFIRPFFQERLIFDSEMDLRYFPWRSPSRNDSLTLTADISQKFHVPLSHNFYFTPKAELFVYHSNFLSQTGTNLFLGIGLTYSHLWKSGT